MREASLQRQVLNLINGEPDGWATKIFGGGLFSQNGLPDIFASISGVFLAIETKTETGKLTRIQEYQHLRIRRKGGLVIVARSIDDVQTAIFGIRALKRSGAIGYTPPTSPKGRGGQAGEEV